jgi:lysophospholipase L1-like esterase
MRKRIWLIAAAGVFGVGLLLHYAVLARHGTLVMLGDSITAGTNWNALLPRFAVANHGIPGEKTEGALKRIDTIIAMHPQCVAVMLGINDLLAGRTVQQISENYKTIIDSLRLSGTTVIVESTLATSRSFAQFNTSVIDLDHSLEAMCRQSGQCLYLDLNSTLAPQGTLDDTADGLHIGPNSYRLWASTLTPLLNANCRSRPSRT